jgi:hypothetical protein
VELTRFHLVGGYIGWFLALGYVGYTYGGLYWLPFGIFLLPALVVAAGFIYGKATGASDVSMQDALAQAQERADEYTGDDDV